MQPHANLVAARIGFDEATIARIAALGQLERLALTEPAIRERVYRAHLAHLRARAGRGRGGRSTDQLRLSPPAPRLEP